MVIYDNVARSGSLARITYVLEKNKEGMTIEAIAELTGLSSGTTYVKMRELFRGQVVEEVRNSDQRIFRLRIPDIAIANIDSRKIRSLEDLE